jgi:hypothetical protein
MPEKESRPTRETNDEGTYIRAARYASDDLALSAYTQAQNILFDSDCDLSAYRLRYRDIPHVVLIGSLPPSDIDAKLAQALADGQQAELPPEISSTLMRRRRQARQLGPWVEGHYRPGRPFPTG